LNLQKIGKKIMATSISWTNETWNPLVGCSKLSLGCQKCYAADAAKSARLQQFSQYQKVKEWDGTIEFVESQLLKPLSWRSPKMIFVCSMSDIFHANVKDEWLDQIFAIMAIAHQHTFQILTKRPERMQKFLGGRTPLPNVWLGVSVENQKAADDRIPLLLTTPAAVRFLSCEPLLEAIDLNQRFRTSNNGYELTWLDYLNWIIIGGESGSNARICSINWIRSIVQQCQPTNVAVFVKQLGSKPIDPPQLWLNLKDRKGGNIDEFPEDLRIRQFPVN
jgi:protein gp37